MTLLSDLKKASLKIGYCKDCRQFVKDSFNYCACGNHPKKFIRLIPLFALKKLIKHCHELDFKKAIWVQAISEAKSKKGEEK